jgi:hypothetical protein
MVSSRSLGFRYPPQFQTGAGALVCKGGSISVTAGCIALW